jgi:hypothetical protein
VALALTAACGSPSPYDAFPRRSLDAVSAPIEGAPAPEGSRRLRESLCATAALPAVAGGNDDALVAFLEARGLAVRTLRERSDLVYLDVAPRNSASAPGAAPPGASPSGAASPSGRGVRLRVATLPTAAEAGQELHRALLQQGQGAWGVRRGNVAVLAERAPFEVALSFAAETGLACWGVLTVAGRDDAFVVPGGYQEL